MCIRDRRQVAHEHEGTLEHTDQEGWPTGVVGGDPDPELGDAGLEILGRDDHPAHAVGVLE